LHGRFAPFVVAILSLVFTADRPFVAVADAHGEIGEAIQRLRAAGYDEDDRRVPRGQRARNLPPVGPGRVARSALGPYADGNNEIRPAWRKGFQILGRDQLTRDAAPGALRARRRTCRCLRRPVETGRRFY